jgi:predicted Zn-dependent protease
MRICRFLLIASLFFATSAQAFTLGPSKWPQGDTTMYLGSLSGSSTSGTSWKDAYTEAATLWNNNTNFTFNLSNASVAACSESDLRNYMAFRGDVCGDAWGDSTLAVTITYSFNSTPSATAKTDILFNDTLNWDVYHGPVLPAAHDFRRVTVHELGHALGLDHETTATAIMAPFEGSIEAPTSNDLAGVAALYGAPSGGGNALAPIKIELETPRAGEVLSGIANFQGWVVSSAAIQKVELFVDSKLIGNIPFGGVRDDVRDAWPQYPNAANAGFSMAYAYSSFTPGTHTALVRAYDVNGNIQEASATFTTVEFNNTLFFSDPNKINLRNATAVFPPAENPGYQMIIDNAVVDGKAYAILLVWRTATQNFEIHTITPK